MSSDISLPLAAWNFMRLGFFQFNPLCPHRRGSVRISWHSLCTFSLFNSVDNSSKPFQSTRFRYSLTRKWVVQWSSCSLGTSTRTLCSPDSLRTMQPELWQQVLMCFWFEAYACSWQIFDDFEPRLACLSSSHSLFSCPQQIPDMCIKALRCRLSGYTRSQNLFNLFFALPDGPRCRCPPRFCQGRAQKRVCSPFVLPLTDTFWLCYNFDQESLFATCQSHSSISSIKSVNEMQYHSWMCVLTGPAFFQMTSSCRMHPIQRAAARLAWVLLTAGGTHGHPLWLGRCIESLQLSTPIWLFQGLPLLWQTFHLDDSCFYYLE